MQKFACQDIPDFCIADQCFSEPPNIFHHSGPNLHYRYDNLRNAAHIFGLISVRKGYELAKLSTLTVEVLPSPSVQNT